MFEALRNPEILIGVTGFLATVFIPTQYRRRREVFYDVISELRLLRVEQLQRPAQYRLQLHQHYFAGLTLTTQGMVQVGCVHAS